MTMHPSSCQTAMANLELLLNSYNNLEDRNPSIQETLFDNTFDSCVRMELNGNAYKRDFLLLQIQQNFARSLRIRNVSMETLDHENFDYTFQIDQDENEGDIQNLRTFHSLATVKDGKILKIKPMTGTAYLELFQENIEFERRQRRLSEEFDAKSLQSANDGACVTPPSTPMSLLRNIKTIVTPTCSPMLPVSHGNTSVSSTGSIKKIFNLPRLSKRDSDMSDISLE